MRKRLQRTPMLTHLVELEVKILVWVVFVCFLIITLCKKATESLASLRTHAGSSGPSQLTYVKSTNMSYGGPYEQAYVMLIFIAYLQSL